MSIHPLRQQFIQAFTYDSRRALAKEIKDLIPILSFYPNAKKLTKALSERKYSPLANESSLPYMTLCAVNMLGLGVFAIPLRIVATHLSKEASGKKSVYAAPGGQKVTRSSSDSISKKNVYEWGAIFYPTEVHVDTKDAAQDTVIPTGENHHPPEGEITQSEVRQQREEQSETEQGKKEAESVQFASQQVESPEVKTSECEASDFVEPKVVKSKFKLLPKLKKFKKSKSEQSEVVQSKVEPQDLETTMIIQLNLKPPVSIQPQPEVDSLKVEKPNLEPQKVEQPAIVQPQPEVDSPRIVQSKPEPQKVKQPVIVQAQPKLKQPKSEPQKVKQPAIVQPKSDQAKPEPPKIGSKSEPQKLAQTATMQPKLSEQPKSVQPKKEPEPGPKLSLAVYPAASNQTKNDTRDPCKVSIDVKLRRNLSTHTTQNLLNPSADSHKSKKSYKNPFSRKEEVSQKKEKRRQRW